MKNLKKNRDTLDLMKHILESAENRLLDKEIDPEYRKILESKIPVLIAKIQNFEQIIRS